LRFCRALPLDVPKLWRGPIRPNSGLIPASAYPPMGSGASRPAAGVVESLVRRLMTVDLAEATRQLMEPQQTEGRGGAGAGPAELLSSALLAVAKLAADDPPLRSWLLGDKAGVAAAVAAAGGGKRGAQIAAAVRGAPPLPRGALLARLGEALQSGELAGGLGSAARMVGKGSEHVGCGSTGKEPGGEAECYVAELYRRTAVNAAVVPSPIRLGPPGWGVPHLVGAAPCLARGGLRKSMSHQYLGGSSGFRQVRASVGRSTSCGDAARWLPGCGPPF
jgi:hypothetical protein